MIAIDLATLSKLRMIYARFYVLADLSKELPKSIKLFLSLGNGIRSLSLKMLMLSVAFIIPYVIKVFSIKGCRSVLIIEGGRGKSLPRLC